MHKIAVIDDFQNVVRRFADWDSLGSTAEVTVFNNHLVSEDELCQRLQPFDMLCVMRERTPLTRSLLSRLPNLRMVASTGPWNASIDIEATDELGITVCGTGTSLTAAAEHTWALIMAAARNLPDELAAFKTGGWQVSVGADLHGKTLGLLGLGYTGAAAARIGQAFGMELIAWSQNMTPEFAAAHGAKYVSKDELMRASDFLSVHVRLSDRTRGLIGKRELELMRPHAYLINTARGPIVDEQALVDILRARHIRGAAVDVYGIEPLPAEHPFRSLDNFIGTSHLGYVTEQSYEVYYGESLENMRAWIAGNPIRVLTSSRREIDYQSKAR